MKRYDTFIQRLAAAIIDGIIFAVVTFVLDIFWFSDTPPLLRSISYDALAIVYSVYAHGRYGQTIGKWASDIKVVQYRDETKCIGLQAAFMRDIVWIASLVMGPLLVAFRLCTAEQASDMIGWFSLGWLVAELVTLFFNKKRRAVHDLIAGSVVIDIKRPTRWEQRFMKSDQEKQPG